MWLPSGWNSDVISLSLVVDNAVVVGAGVVIGLSVQTTQMLRPNYNVGSHGLRMRLEISETI